MCDWADVVVIAPLDANTLGKIATGITDNLLTHVVRSWSVTKPLLFAPAMNTLMWQHPITSRQIDTLVGFGFEQIECIEKTLACGDTGKGALATVESIVGRVRSHVLALLQKKS
jgi:phosphopantothenoylcysteine decarboxylase